jgi:hypothetical protein
VTIGIGEKLAFEKGHDPAGFHAFGEGLWVPPSWLYGETVATMQYVGGAAGAGAAGTGGQETTSSPVGTETFRAVATGGVSAIIIASIPHPGRVYVSGASTRGAVITDVVVYYSVIAQVLSGQPTATAAIIQMPVVGAAAALPVATAITVTKNPTTFNLAVNTAGQYQAHQFVFAASGAPSADGAKVFLRMTWPMTNAGTLDIAGLLVRYGIQ